MIDMMLGSIASFAPTQQGSAASQNLIKLETELEKRKQQLRQQGVVLTPEKPSSSTASAAKSTGQHPGHLPLPIAGHAIEHNDTSLTKLDSIPAGTLKSYAKKLQGTIYPCSAVFVQNIQENVECRQVRRV